MDNIKNKTIIGLTHDVIVEGVKVKAKVDTGADKSSIDHSLFEKIDKNKDKKILGFKKFISALGEQKREITKLKIEIENLKFKVKFTIADRKDLKYKVLIGKNILKKGKFLIDSSLS